MTQTSPIPRVGRALLVLGAVLCAGAVGPHERLGELNYRMLPEASGMGISPSVDGRLWFINDAGNRPELIGLDLPNFDYTKIKVKGVRNRDWEDLEVFEVNGQPWIAVADIGDNLAVRKQVSIYLFPEPPTDTTSVDVFHTITVEYPGGARDSESLAVDPISGHIYILSKRDTPPVLYRVPLPDLSKPGASDLVADQLGEVSSIPAPTALEVRLFPKYGKYRNQPTSLSLAPDGQTIAIMTYGEAYLTKLGEDRDWLTALNQELCPLGSPLLAQPETIAVDGDGSVYLSSERKQAPLIRMSTVCAEASGAD
ncbi:MAG: hypothetical protein AAF578_11085 [Pseudomonadota bacterium]